MGVVKSDMKDVSCSGPHSHAVLLLNSFRNGAEISTMCGENFLSWLTTPINLQSSVTLVGGAICFRASSFCGSADMPFSLITWPRKVMEFIVSSYLLGFIGSGSSPKLVSIVNRALLRSCHMLKCHLDGRVLLANLLR